MLANKRIKTRFFLYINRYQRQIRIQIIFIRQSDNKVTERDKTKYRKMHFSYNHPLSHFSFVPSKRRITYETYTKEMDNFLITTINSLS